MFTSHVVGPEIDKTRNPPVIEALTLYVVEYEQPCLRLPAIATKTVPEPSTYPIQKTSPLKCIVIQNRKYFVLMRSYQTIVVDIQSAFSSESLAAVFHALEIVQRLYAKSTSLSSILRRRLRPFQNLNLGLHQAQRSLLLAICVVVCSHCRVPFEVD